MPFAHHQARLKQTLAFPFCRGNDIRAFLQTEYQSALSEGCMAKSDRHYQKAVKQKADYKQSVK